MCFIKTLKCKTKKTKNIFTNPCFIDLKTQKCTSINHGIDNLSRSSAGVGTVTIADQTWPTGRRKSISFQDFS